MNFLYYILFGGITSFHPKVSKDLPVDEESFQHSRRLSKITPKNAKSVLDVDFRPTIFPVVNFKKVQNAHVSYGLSSILSYGKFGLINSCRKLHERLPCNSPNVTPDRPTCFQWGCCWDGDSKVPCAQNIYYVYGFILSNNLVTPPPTKSTNVSTTPHTPITTTDLVSISTTPTISTTTSTTTTSTLSTTTTEEPGPDFSQCGKPPSMTEEKALAVARRSNILNSLLLSRILGGKSTSPGEWPWVAYLYEKHNGKTDGFFCGGALVGDQWVVTAAHCITQAFSPEVYGVVLGKFYAGSESEHEVTYDVIDIVLHHRYSLTTFNNDVCMLKLNKPVVYTRHIQRLCILPQGFPSDNTTGKTFAGRICTTIGWGRTDAKDVADKLQQLNVVILPHILCTSTTTVPTSLPYQGRGVEKDDPKMCAGGVKGEDTCDGDSGGPLICLNDDGRHYLHAITSYGTNPCGQKNLPGVYTRMADYHDWMRDIIEST